LSTTTFAEVTAVTPEAPGRFTATVSPAWTIGGKPNGGYLLALLGRAATADATHPDPLAASAHYLASPDPGPVTIEVEPLRDGRAIGHVRARLRQGDRTCVEALFTTGRLGDTPAPSWEGNQPDPGTSDLTAGIRVPAMTPSGIPVAIMDEVDIRLDPDSTRFATDGPTGRGELRGWLTLPDQEHFDPQSLLYAVDAFPPATFDIAPTGWVPTLELTVHVRARPAPGPVRVLHRAHLIDDGWVDESCHVRDVTGRLVAHGTQLAGIRLP